MHTPETQEFASCSRRYASTRPGEGGQRLLDVLTSKSCVFCFHSAKRFVASRHGSRQKRCRIFCKYFLLEGWNVGTCKFLAIWLCFGGEIRCFTMGDRYMLFFRVCRWFPADVGRSFPWLRKSRTVRALSAVFHGTLRIPASFECFGLFRFSLVDAVSLHEGSNVAHYGAARVHAVDIRQSV